MGRYQDRKNFLQDWDEMGYDRAKLLHPEQFQPPITAPVP